MLKYKQTLYYLFLLVVIPSIFLFLFALWVGRGLSIINVDLLIACSVSIILMRRNKIFGSVVASVFMLITCGVSVSYFLGFVYISDPALIVSYINFWRNWPWGYILGVTVIIIIPVIFLNLIILFLKPKEGNVGVGLILALIFIFADIYLGTNHFGGERKISSINIATSSGWKLYSIINQWYKKESYLVIGEAPESMAFQISNAGIRHKKILSIAVESWGIIDNEEGYDKMVVSRLGDLLSHKYKFNYVEVPFTGGTLSGEIRELCGRYTVGVPSVQDLVNKVGNDCIPSKLSKLGYSTWAGHANVGGFYNRSNLYPVMGFDISKFESSFGEVSKYCGGGVFNGPCDAIVLKSAVEHLGTSELAFAHVITLETHLPLKADSNIISKCGKKNMPNDICIYIEKFDSVFHSIGDIIVSRKIYPDLIYIYGDHAPPYVKESTRLMFSQKNIPFLRLELIDE